jgi:hypothetical protein
MSASGIKPLLLALLLAGCQMNVGTLEVRLVYSSDQYPLDPMDVSTLRVRIEGDGLDTQNTGFSLLGGSGGVLADIPLGKNRVLTVEGLDSKDNVQSRGVSAPFSIESGNKKVYLYFSQVEKFSGPPWGSDEEDWKAKYWTSLRSPRVFHTATLLPDGTVVVIGGAAAPDPNDFLGRISDADPTIVRFETTPCAIIHEQETTNCSTGKLCMHKKDGRAHHSANLLPGGTHVVVAGGEPVVSGEEWPAEYYSIQTHSFETRIGVDHNRTRHAAAVLTGSREGVVIAGGEGQLASEVWDSVELFEAGDFEVQSAAALKGKRTGPVAVAYPDHVLVIGGWEAPDQASDLVDWIHFDEEPPRAEELHMKYERAGHSAVLLESAGNYEVFVCGGLRYDQGLPVVVDSCEMLNLENGSSTEYPGVRRWGHTATVLQDGRMLLAGGFSSVPPTLAENSAVLFDTPVGPGSRRTIPMVSRRAGHTATLLSNGMVVLIGGVGRMGVVQMPGFDYEIFNPRP